MECSYGSLATEVGCSKSWDTKKALRRSDRSTWEDDGCCERSFDREHHQTTAGLQSLRTYCVVLRMSSSTQYGNNLRWSTTESRCRASTRSSSAGATILSHTPSRPKRSIIPEQHFVPFLCNQQRHLHSQTRWGPRPKWSRHWRSPRGPCLPVTESRGTAAPRTATMRIYSYARRCDRAKCKIDNEELRIIAWTCQLEAEATKAGFALRRVL